MSSHSTLGERMVQGSSVKRLLDVVASFVGLVVLSPVLVGIAILVRGSSEGPVIYRQVRMGRGGRPFHLLKFRTMIVGADRSSRLTTGNDPRVTRVGAALRRTNLDELPQLANVLKGDMSLVGPRPEVPEFVDMSDPLWRETLSVRPGMTAPVTVELRREAEILAQFEDPVEGYRAELLPTKLLRNVEYVRGRTFVGDLRVLLATFRDIISRESP